MNTSPGEVHRMVVNLRGPGASGKTTLARRFIDPSTEFTLGTFEGTEVKATTTPIEGLRLPVTVIGTYRDTLKYSGCDYIKSAEAIEAALRAAIARDDLGHILFEGFRVSKSWARFIELRNEMVRLRTIRWLWAFLHAPMELIVERNLARRDPSSRPLNLKELKSIIGTMNSIRYKVLDACPVYEVLTLNPQREPQLVYHDLLSRMATREVSEA